MSKKAKPKKKKKRASGMQSSLPRCGLCGKTAKLTRTECCNQWICNDADQYVLFSFARNSCNRNHDHYTLCAYHHHEGHSGSWKDCQKCRDAFETEMYVWRGTNEYNFEKLENPPDFEPTRCHQCGKVIRLGDSYYQGEYSCAECSADLMNAILPRPGRSPGRKSR